MADDFNDIKVTTSDLTNSLSLLAGVQTSPKGFALVLDENHLWVAGSVKEYDRVRPFVIKT